jgi:hypothetical protein
LKKVLGIVLRICNFINHGAKDLGAKGIARGFALESLTNLSSFKMGQVSAMHFICLTMMASDQKFFQALHDSLQHIHLASREKPTMLSSCIEAFQRDADFLRRELELLDESVDATVKDRMVALGDTISDESDVLKENLDVALKLGKEVQKYFGVGTKGQAQPIDQFFGHLASFLNSLEKCKDEIEKNPSVYKKFLSPGEKKDGNDKVGLLDRQPKHRSRALTTFQSEPEAKPQPKTLRRVRTTDFASQEERLNTIRENEQNVQRTLAEAGPRPSAGAFSTTSAPSCSSSTAGSDVAFMLDVDDLIDSIFSLCSEDAADTRSMSSQDPCSRATSPTRKDSSAPCSRTTSPTKKESSANFNASEES